MLSRVLMQLCDLYGDEVRIYLVASLLTDLSPDREAANRQSQAKVLVDELEHLGRTPRFVTMLSRALEAALSSGSRLLRSEGDAKGDERSTEPVMVTVTALHRLAETLELPVWLQIAFAIVAATRLDQTSSKSGYHFLHEVIFREYPEEGGVPAGKLLPLSILHQLLFLLRTQRRAFAEAAAGAAGSSSSSSSSAGRSPETVHQECIRRLHRAHPSVGTSLALLPVLQGPAILVDFAGPMRGTAGGGGNSGQAAAALLRQTLAEDDALDRRLDELRTNGSSGSALEAWVEATRVAGLMQELAGPEARTSEGFRSLLALAGIGPSVPANRRRNLSEPEVAVLLVALGNALPADHVDSDDDDGGDRDGKTSGMSSGGRDLRPGPGGGGGGSSGGGGPSDELPPLLRRMFHRALVDDETKSGDDDDGSLGGRGASSQGPSMWSASTVGRVIRTVAPDLDWRVVVRCLDMPSIPRREVEPVGVAHMRGLGPGSSDVDRARMRSQGASATGPSLAGPMEHYASFRFVVRAVRAGNGGRPFPADILVHRWRHAPAQLAALELASMAPPTLVSLASVPRLMEPVVESSGSCGIANQLWCSVDFYHALMRLAHGGGLQPSCIRMLQRARDAVPELVLLGLAYSKVEAREEDGREDSHVMRGRMFDRMFQDAFGELVAPQRLRVMADQAGVHPSSSPPAGGNTAGASATPYSMDMWTLVQGEPTALHVSLLERLWDASPMLTTNFLLRIARALTVRQKPYLATSLPGGASLGPFLVSVSRVVFLLRTMGAPADQILACVSSVDLALVTAIGVAVIFETPAGGPSMLRAGGSASEGPSASAPGDGSSDATDPVDLWFKAALTRPDKDAAEAFGKRCLHVFRRIVDAPHVPIAPGTASGGASSDGLPSASGPTGAASSSSPTESTVVPVAVLLRFYNALRTHGAALGEGFVEECQRLFTESCRKFPALLSASNREIEEAANGYFQQLYRGRLSVDQLTEILQRFKDGDVQRDRDVLHCMVRNLFCEFPFFNKYPERELQLTGHLFGALVRQHLIPESSTGTALRYVLDSLRSVASSGEPSKLARFGMCALEQFKHSLPQWPQYAALVLDVPYIRAHHPKFVAEVESVLGEKLPKSYWDAHRGERSSSSFSGPGTVPASGAPPVPTQPAMPRNDIPAEAPASTMAPPMGQQQPRVGASAAPQPQTATSATSPSLSSSYAPSAGTSLPAPVSTAVTQARLREQVREMGPYLSDSLAALVADEPFPPPPAHQSCSNRERYLRAHRPKREVLTPPSQVTDRIHFIINNATETNLEEKMPDLQRLLHADHERWLAQYLVVKRVATQPNFHALYLRMLRMLDRPGLVQEVLHATVDTALRLLASDRIQSSHEDRAQLKHIGAWLGQLTLERDHPLPYKLLDMRSLLLEAYETGRLMGCVAFVSKFLQGAKKSMAFPPTNPWMMSLLRLLREIQVLPNLKMNISYETVIAARFLGVKMDDLEASNLLASSRRPRLRGNLDFNLPEDEEPVVPGIPPDLREVEEEDDDMMNGDGSSADGVAAEGGASASSHVRRLPGMARLVRMQPIDALGAGIAQGPFRRSLREAVNEVVHELLRPTAVRSVAVACMTTRELIWKDFAAEPRADCIEAAAQRMGMELAGSLALATCQDSARQKLEARLRDRVAGSELEKAAKVDFKRVSSAMKEWMVQNAHVVCALVEKAAMDKARRDMSLHLKPVLEARRRQAAQGRTIVPEEEIAAMRSKVAGGRPVRWPRSLPPKLQPDAAGLSPQQLQVYSFERSSATMHALQQHRNNAAAVGGGEVRAATGSEGGKTQEATGGEPHPQERQRARALFNNQLLRLRTGLSELQAMAHTADSVPTTLRGLPHDHMLIQVIQEIPRVGLQVPPAARAEATLVFARVVVAAMLEVSSESEASPGARLAIQALVAVLGSLQPSCPNLQDELIEWLHSLQKNLPRVIPALAALARAGLWPVEQLDERLVMAMDEGNDAMGLAAACAVVHACLVLERGRGIGVKQLPNTLQALVALSRLGTTPLSVSHLLTAARAAMEGQTLSAELTGASQAAGSRFTNPVNAAIAGGTTAHQLMVQARSYYATVEGGAAQEHPQEPSSSAGVDAAAGGAADASAVGTAPAPPTAPAQPTDPRSLPRGGGFVLDLTQSVVPRTDEETAVAGVSAPAPGAGAGTANWASGAAGASGAATGRNGAPEVAAANRSDQAMQQTVAEGANAAIESSLAAIGKQAEDAEYILPSERSEAPEEHIGGTVTPREPGMETPTTRPEEDEEGEQEEDEEDEETKEVRSQVLFLLEQWVQTHAEVVSGKGSETVLSDFVQRLRDLGVFSSGAVMEQFFRVTMELCVESSRALSTEASRRRGGAEKDQAPARVVATRLSYTGIDALCKLIVLVVKSAETDAGKLNLVAKLLLIVARMLLNDADSHSFSSEYHRHSATGSTRGGGGDAASRGGRGTEEAAVEEGFDQRPYLRLLTNIFRDLMVPSSDSDEVQQFNLQVATMVADMLHALRPTRVPAFALAWLELVSHRFLLPHLLDSPRAQGWPLLERLLEDLFHFIGAGLRGGRMGEGLQLLYRGTMRFLLVLLHDVPDFLEGYHFPLCNALPPACVQLRNLILSAFPRSMRLPDPFSSNLKVDQLPEIRKPPRLFEDPRTVLGGPHAEELASFLRNGSPPSFVSSLHTALLCSPEERDLLGMRYHAPRVNATVLLTGILAVAQLRSAESSDMARSPAMALIRNLAMEMEADGRHLLLNGLANQLRYPNSHTHFFSCAILLLFAEAPHEVLREQVTRVLLERLIAHRPHPWGLLITFIELIKNSSYKFWDHEFTQCAPEIQRVFESVSRNCMRERKPDSSGRTTASGSSGP